jgi:hypothetical protein
LELRERERERERDITGKKEFSISKLTKFLLKSIIGNELKLES